MGILARDNKQLILIYSEDSHLGKKLVPYAESSKKALRLINLNKEPIADSIWVEIADLLNKPLGEIFTTSDLNNLDIDVDDANRFSNKDWLKIIDKNPSLLQHPIAINGNKVTQVDDRFDFFEFYDADGSNFDKSEKAIKQGMHEDETGQESF